MILKIVMVTNLLWADNVNENVVKKHRPLGIATFWNVIKPRWVNVNYIHGEKTWVVQLNTYYIELITAINNYKLQIFNNSIFYFSDNEILAVILKKAD